MNKKRKAATEENNPKEAPYAVIIPCKDGEANIEKTLDSVLHQTVRPERIIVVDDASRDKTPIILKKFTAIKVVHLEHNYPKNFARIPKLINIASRYLPTDCRYLMLLGDDSILQNDYVERLLSKFTANPRLKIASGDMRRRKMVKTIAGLPQGSGRVIDLVFLRKHLPFPESIGWESWILFKGMQEGDVAAFSDVVFEHERQYGTYSIRTFGHSMYVLGYPPLFAVARFAKDFLLKSYSSRFHSFYLLLGYVEYWFTNQKKLGDVTSFVRETQNARLVNFLRRRLVTI